MFESMLSGLQHIMSWQVLAFVLLGVIIGLVFGVIPGLGGITALAIFIPFVFGMEPFMGFAFMLSMHALSATGGSIPSILFSIPGTPVNVATAIDGYPMTQQGRGAQALGAALTASAVGGVIGALVLAGLIPILRPISMALGPAEIFMLIVFGLTFIIVLSRESLLKGFSAALLGLGLCTVGLDPHTGIGRFTYDQLWLWEGIPIIPLVLGLFAFSEMIDLGAKGGQTTIAKTVESVGGVRQLLEGSRAVFTNWWMTIRVAALGSFLGIIPGIGGDAGSWICYGHAAQTCKDRGKFGKGDVRGVIAPEVANNAKEGGALLPTVVFGIPGSTGMAVLLGAFLILGLSPGPQMIKEHLDLVWSMVWVLIISNIIGVALLFPLVRYMAKLAFLRASLFIPPVLVLSALGALLERGRWQDLVLAIVFGFGGYGMKKYGFPRAPLILGFILGGLAEHNLNKALDIWGVAFLGRPTVLVLLGMIALSFAFSVWTTYRERKEGVQI